MALNNTQKNNKESGVTLLLAILILSSILAISFSLATILLIEVRTSADLLRTEEAFYGAQGVSEEVLYGVKQKVANFQPGSNAYTIRTSNGRVSLSSTSSPISDPQLNEQVPVGNDSLMHAKRYILYNIYAEDPNTAGSGYGMIEVTFKNTDVTSRLHVYICEFDPKAIPGTGDVMQICSDAGAQNSYWTSSDKINYILPSPGSHYSWELNPEKQQELILYNESSGANPGTIYVKIEAFDIDKVTPKGIPYFEQTVVDTNASNNGVNRKLRTIVPQN